MQAVQTRHLGVQYRSRTEAEWAAVLGAHQIRYAYEPIAFFFGLVAPERWLYADAYLPDFWLAERRLWLEVKPHAPNIIEYRKAALLAECTGAPVLITTGGPSEREEAMLVKGVDTYEMASTLEGGPLNLQIDLLSEAQSVHPGFRNFSEAFTDAIVTLGAAYKDAWDKPFHTYRHRQASDIPNPKPKRVVFLLPEDDYRTSCFCGREPHGYCWSCSSLMRCYVTDESAKRLEAAGARKTPDARETAGSTS